MEINKFEIADDILTVCIVADSFPMGIKKAYHDLDGKVDKRAGRKLYGVTEMSNGQIIYRACLSKVPGANDSPGLQAYTIPKGTYLATLFEWEGHEDEIGNIFTNLLKHPGAKDDSIGVEEYYVSPKEARLMVQHK
jgi:predicted transcriptional regulator YdeE